MADSEIAPADLQSMLTTIKNSDSLVVSIITHRFPARDLYKLHPPDASEEDLRDASLYKTPSSVLLPLQVYFAILNEYFNGLSYYITRGSLAYRKHLQYLIDEYEWPKVLEYHFAYFDRQVFRMRREALGSPIDWLTPDYQLMDQYDPTPEDASAHSNIIPPTEVDTEKPIQTITVMLRRARDPLADDGMKYVNYAKHKIVKSLSCLHLPHPFENVTRGWMILDVDHF